MAKPPTNARAVLIFMKYPTPGSVKTRLAQTIGAEQACQLYRQFVSRVLRQLQPARPQTTLIGLVTGAPPTAFAQMDDWSNQVDDWWAQADGSLGDRLADGFQRALPIHQHVVVMGTDCLEISCDLLNQSFDHLRHFDMVLGPANDGGYYLLGLKHHVPGLFENIRWSHPQTSADQRQRAQQLNLSWVELPIRHDIDTHDDWRAYQQRQAQQ